MADEKKDDAGAPAARMETEESSSSGPSGSSAPRFEIKKWNAVTMWSWDICADTCAICRNSLNEPSIEYQVRSVIVSRRTNLRGNHFGGTVPSWILTCLHNLLQLIPITGQSISQQ